MTDWLELDRALGAIASSGFAEVREDGEWLAELAALRYELHHEGKTPLVHLWSDDRNLTRRVLRVREQSRDRIVLEVQRFGRAKPGRLEFQRADSPRSPGRVTRALPADSRRAFPRRDDRFAFGLTRSRTFVLRALRSRTHAGRFQRVGCSGGFARRERRRD